MHFHHSTMAAGTWFAAHQCLRDHVPPSYQHTAHVRPHTGYEITIREYCGAQDANDKNYHTLTHHYDQQPAPVVSRWLDGDCCDSTATLHNPVTIILAARNTFENVRGLDAVLITISPMCTRNAPW